MPRRLLFNRTNGVLALTSLLVPTTAYVALHRRRLNALYPEERSAPLVLVDPAHDLSQVHAFSATLPARWLAKDEDLAAAFWSSRPVQLERFVVKCLPGAALSTGPDAEATSFAPGSVVLDGLFQVSRRDVPAPLTSCIEATATLHGRRYRHTLAV